MSDRYAVINPDTLEAMRRAGHVAKLEARIEKLEAALRAVIRHAGSAGDYYLADKTRKALEGKYD